MISFVVILLLLASSAETRNTSFKDCNASQFDFFSAYQLGKQDELNLTFAKLPSQMAPLSAVTYNSSDLLFRYSLSNTKTAFLYLDSKQKGEVISDDTIYINGGKAETSLQFQWSLNSQKGVGRAECLTDLISFAKLVYLDQGFLLFKVGDYINISYYSTPCNISRLDPPLESKHRDVLEVMLNTHDGHNVKTLLEDQIAQYYGKTLNQSLYEEKQPITNHSEYIWVDPNPAKNNLTIEYTQLPVGSHLQTIGLSLNFVTEITDYDNWKCGATVPSIPKDPKEYGGKQQYLSLSVLQNTVRYAVEKGQFDSILNRQNWQSSVFQFFAGDLYEIIPILATKYYASQPVQGMCKASPTNLKLLPSINNSLLLSLHYSCSLSIGSTVISQFDVDPNFVIRVDPQHSFLNFYVQEVNKFAHFKDVESYEIHDIELANLFLMRSLQRVREGPVFGSGWKTYERDYPAILTQDGLFFIYDRALGVVDSQ